MDEQNHASLSKLGSIKRQIAHELLPLIGHISDPQDRYYAFTDLLRNEWDDNLLAEAFEAAKDIPDIEDRVRALQTLLSDASYRERDLQELEEKSKS